MSNEGPENNPFSVESLTQSLYGTSGPGFSQFVTNQPEQLATGNLFTSVFQQENMIASWVRNKTFENSLGKSADPTFNAANWIPAGYEEHADLFMLAQSREDIPLIKSQIDREQNAKLLQSQHPLGSLLYGFVANAVDPTVLIPGGTVYKEYKLAQNIKRSALSLGAAAGAATFVQEAGLRETQLTRTPEESAWNVLAASLLGAGFGSLGGAVLGGPVGKRAIKETAQVLEHGPMPPQPVAPRVVTSEGLPKGEGVTGPVLKAAGASEVDLATLKESESLWRIQPFVNKIPGIAPLFRMVKSPFLTTKEFANSMVEHNYFTNKNFQGGGNANIETRIKQRMRSFYAGMTLSIRDGFYKQAGIETKTPVIRDIAALMSKEGMSFNDWQAQLTRAFRNNGEHPNPAVQAVAQDVKAKLIDVLRDEAIALEMLPEGVTPETALGYITKIRDINKIIEDHAKPAALGGQRYKRILIQGLTDIRDQLVNLQPEIKRIEGAISETNKMLKAVERDQKRLNNIKKFGTQDKNDIVKFQNNIKNAKEKIQKKLTAFSNKVREKEAVVKNLKKDLDGLRVPVKGLKKEEIQANAKAKRELQRKISKANQDVIKERKLLTEFKNGEKKSLEKVIRDNESSINKGKRNLGDIDELKKRITDNNPDELKATLKSLEDELEATVPRKLKTKTKAGKLKIRKVLSDAEIDVSAEQMIESFIGAGEERFVNPLLSELLGTKASPDVFKSRTVMIDDLLEEDFLINDAELLLSHIVRAMVPIIELTKAAKSMGLNSFSEMRSGILKDLADEYIKSLQGKLGVAVAKLENHKLVAKQIAELEAKPVLNNVEKHQLARAKEEIKGESLAQLEKAVDKLEPKAAKEALKLRDQFESDISDMNAIFDINLGIYRSGFNVLDNSARDFYRNLRDWNFSRFGGFMGIASIPEIVAHAMKVGPMKVLQEGLVPQISEWLGGVKSLPAKMQDALLRDLQYAVQSEMGTILKPMMDGEGLGVRRSPVRRFFSSAAEVTAEMSLIKKIQDISERITGRIVISDILRNIDDAVNGRISKFNDAKLNQLGLTKSTRKQIYDWWKEHGGMDDGSYWLDHTMIDVSNTKKMEIYQLFRDAITKDIDTSVVKTGAGDRPLITRSEIGKIVFQFKDWASGATTRLLLPGIQRSDAEFYSGTLFLLFGGLMSHLITQVLRGNEIDWSPDVLAIEAFDKSGIGGLFGEAANIGAKALFGTGTTRYMSRSTTGAFLGPSFDVPDQLLGLFNKAYRAANPDAEPLRAKDLEAAARLVPLQNMAWFYQLRQAGVRETASALGLED